MNHLLQNDLDLLSSTSFTMCAGLDEAGRGALAGPVVVAAVVLDYHIDLPVLNDSKQLTARQRDKLYSEIVSSAICYSIAAIPAKTIDRVNILQATLLGFKKAFFKLEPKAQYALVDGKDIPPTIPGRAVIKGDSRQACIAAASVLAKVYRDRLMIEMDKLYPEYSFAQHKGYGTKAHYAALNSFGACKEHRKTFRLH
ncbi:MAG: ribonuclease HII [Candidatus Cloacimonetes bacterium]|nr:ribonuclease HII [Candidatus Cloacimonadota bacterium]MDD3282025.1 ribonuclease HII [Candidatus Cloacimonadota bacterium]